MINNVLMRKVSFKKTKVVCYLKRCEWSTNSTKLTAKIFPWKASRLGSPYGSNEKCFTDKESGIFVN